MTDTQTRLRAVRRNVHGEVMVGRREYHGSTHAGALPAAHTVMEGRRPTAACSGEQLDSDSVVPLSEVAGAQRCQRLGCRLLWRDRTLPFAVTPTEAAALQRLLDRYLATEEADPIIEPLRGVYDRLGELPQDHRPFGEAQP